MSTFADTSALMAVVDRDDLKHAEALAAWERLIRDRERIVCTNYVFLEASALIQNRLGLQAVRTLQADIRPALTMMWVGEEVHEAAIAALLAANRRQVSLVDHVSFETMRRMGIQQAFAFDPHFVEHGFGVLPGQP